MPKKEKLNEVDSSKISGGASVYYICPNCGCIRFAYYNCLSCLSEWGDQILTTICYDCLKLQLDELLKETDIKK